VAAAAARAAEPAVGTRDWKFEYVHLTNGRTFPGLVVEETPTTVRFEYVMRKPGSRTLVFLTTFARKEVARLTRLVPAERDKLAARLRALDPTGEGEQRLMDHLELRPVPWGPSGQRGLGYQADHFLLISDAEENIVRQAAVRLEQIYAAYTRFLPPARPAAAPTTILLARSPAEYQALLKELGRNPFSNPAFYDPARNQIVCASDLQRLSADLDRVRRLHEQYRAEIGQREAEVNKLPKGEVQDRLRKEILAARQRLDLADKKNQAVYEAAARRFFQTLYHEAFHAYLANFVYPTGECAVPRWLNEGLAQIFEGALVEAGELRVGHADAGRLAAVKAAVRKGELLGVADLLRAGPKEFVVAHASDQQVSDRYYTASWALAFYLTFERRKLGTPELDEYVRALQRGTDPLEAFQNLVGQALPAFEKAFRHYLLSLQTDGTTAPALPGRPDAPKR
jgi:hypothetical protein